MWWAFDKTYPRPLPLSSDECRRTAACHITTLEVLVSPWVNHGWRRFEDVQPISRDVWAASCAMPELRSSISNLSYVKWWGCDRLVHCCCCCRLPIHSDGHLGLVSQQHHQNLVKIEGHATDVRMPNWYRRVRSLSMWNPTRATYILEQWVDSC